MINFLNKKSVLMMSVFVLLFGISSFVFFNVNKKEEVAPPVSIPVEKTEDESIIVGKPYYAENIKTYLSFYKKENEENNQQNSLIFYNDTYIPNDSIIYNSEKEFEILAIMPGTITSIKSDELYGNILEITSNEIVKTYYSCIEDIKFSEGDLVNKGAIIGKSGKCNLIPKDNNILINKISIHGNYVDPMDVYGLSIQSLS